MEEKVERKNLNNKCKKCDYAEWISEYWKSYWKEEFIGKKATIVVQSVSMTLSIMAVIINTILILKK